MKLYLQLLKIAMKSNVVENVACRLALTNVRGAEGAQV